MEIAMKDYMARVERAVRNKLGAEVLAVIEVERHEREGYWERAYTVAWTNDKEFGTHRVGIDSKWQEACMWGHYYSDKETAMADFLDRTSLTPTGEIERLKREWRKADDGWIAAKEEIDKLHKDLELSVCYTPQAIRDSFDGADDDNLNAKWAMEASDEQLLDVAHSIVNSDPTWRDFHRNIELAIEFRRDQKDN